MKAFIVFVAIALIHNVVGHSFMTNPTPINTAASNTEACGGANANVLTATTVAATVTAGKTLSVAWPNNGHSGGTVTAGIVDQNKVGVAANTQTSNENAFVAGNIGSSSFNNQQLTATIPAGTAPGLKILQWKWTEAGGSKWYSCALIRVLAAPPADSVVSPSNPALFTLQNNAGTFDATTGTFTCNKGFHLGTDNTGATTCLADGLSGGAAFGVALLVIVLVAIAAVVGIMVFLKIKKPATFDVVVGGVKSVPSKVKGLVVKS